MKKSILLLILLISYSTFSQTKQETIDWLNVKLKENSDSFMGEFKIEINNNSDWGETLLITQKIQNSIMNKSYYYSFLAKNIESVVTTSKYRTDGKLGILISAKGENIYLNNNEFVDEIKIYCLPTSDDTIIRMQKGIIHLLNLMGNPLKAPKELFKD